MGDEGFDDIGNLTVDATPTKLDGKIRKEVGGYSNEDLRKLLLEMSGIPIPINEIGKILPYTFHISSNGSVIIPTALQERANYALGLNIRVENKIEPSSLKQDVVVFHAVEMTEAEHDKKAETIRARKRKFRQRSYGHNALRRLICERCNCAIKTGFFEGKHVLYCRCVEKKEMVPFVLPMANGFPVEWKYGGEDYGDEKKSEEGDGKDRDNNRGDGGLQGVRPDKKRPGGLEEKRSIKGKECPGKNNSKVLEGRTEDIR